MAELLGLGCSHGPIILTPPEVWHKGRSRIFGRIPNYEAPAALIEELGDDNGLTQDRADQKKVVEAFGVLRDRLHQWKPDVLMVIGDDQAENFLQDNLPPSASTPAPRWTVFPSVTWAGRTMCGELPPRPSSASIAPRTSPGT